VRRSPWATAALEGRHHGQRRGGARTPRAPSIGWVGSRVLVGLALVLGVGACAPLRPPAPPPPEPLRLSELAGRGDAQRRSSLELVLEGLDADAAGRPHAARADYENALRIDPTNPWAYVALARHHVVGTTPQRALDFLDQARALLEGQGDWSPRAEAHVVGLRGASLVASGRASAGLPLLERARELSPRVWSDGHLDARELR